MEVEGLHNFITAGGIVLHNCDMLRYYCVSRTMRAEAQRVAEDDDDEDEAAEGYEEFMTGGEASAGYLEY